MWVTLRAFHDQSSSLLTHSVSPTSRHCQAGSWLAWLKTITSNTSDWQFLEHTRRLIHTVAIAEDKV